MKSTALGILLLLTSLGAERQQEHRTLDKIPTVSYCELIRNPNLYANKLVRVHATWKRGFELSALYDVGCLDLENQAWLESLDDDQLCAGAPRRFKKLAREGFTKADVTVTGKLYAGERFGHLNGYNFKFVVSCLESAKQIPFEAP